MLVSGKFDTSLTKQATCNQGNARHHSIVPESGFIGCGRNEK